MQRLSKSLLIAFNILMNIKQKIEKIKLARTLEKIRLTPPIFCKKNGLMVVSQTRHADINAYLLAIKSLYFYIGEFSVTVLDDGTLNQRDKDVLRHHVEGLKIQRIEDYRNKHLPILGTWERLIAIEELIKENYVIQLDSDIVVCRKLIEVIDCVKNNDAFVLSHFHRPGLVTLERMSQWVFEAGWRVRGLQMIAEINFHRLEKLSDKFYLRASSGFSGFPKESFEISELIEFSSSMQKLLGEELWNSWGSEELSSNYILANRKTCRQLIYPQYVNNAPHLDIENAWLVHFFTFYRYYNGRYQRAAEKEIVKLA